MTEFRCENCGQPALRSDQVCWQCGKPLPWYNEDKPAQKVVVKEKWQAPVDLRATTLYALITLAVVLVFLLLTFYLSREPLVQLSMGTPLPDDWVAFTDLDKTYTLILPAGWTTIDGSRPEANPELSDTLLDGHYIGALGPLGDAADSSVVLVAADSERFEDAKAPFVVVGKSRQLNQLSYEEALIYLQGMPEAVLNSRFVDDFEKSHIAVEFEYRSLRDNGELLHCDQRISLGRERAVAISACAPADRFSGYLPIFTGILERFQVLIAD